MIDADLFEASRELLFGLAYRLTGLAGDAEDLVQEAWLRASCDPGFAEHPRAYLATIVTRLALERAKADRRDRERYAGTWLPEPVLTEPVLTRPAADPEGPIERGESMTLGFLVLLETLSPAERAVLVLRDVFGCGYDEVAAALRLTRTNCRQLLHRARMRVGARPRGVRRDPERQRQIVDQFMMSAAGGDVTALTHMLRADAACSTDAGREAVAPQRPASGAEAIARLFIGLAHTGQPPGATMQPAEINHEAGFLAWRDGRLESVWVFSTDNDRITAIRAIRNPAKLQYISRQLTASAL